VVALQRGEIKSETLRRSGEWGGDVGEAVGKTLPGPQGREVFQCLGGIIAT